MLDRNRKMVRQTTLFLQVEASQI